MIDGLTVASARRLLERRELGAEELLAAVLGRLDETEPRVHAYVRVSAEDALREARTADRERVPRPLAGIPLGVKDVLATAGTPTEAGSRLFAGNVPREDADAVRRLRAAGAIVVGKHVTHELACGQDVPPTRNPWNLDCYPGGSSAGGGVSVAAGSSLAALGTDAGGSVRKPAAVTGVTGLKPTFGRVSRRGVLRAASAPSLDHVGLFARTAEDVAMLLAVVAGHDPLDPISLREPVPDYVATLQEPVAGLRIGVLDPGAVAQPDPQVARLAEDGLRELQSAGAVLVSVRGDALRRAKAAAFTVFPAEVARVHRLWLACRPDLYGEGTRLLLEGGLRTTAGELEAARATGEAVRAEVEAAFRDARLDVLASPTLPRAAMPLCEMSPQRDVPAYVPYTAPWNLTGHPALSVPCGFTADGLPAGLQLVGRPLDEATILRAGHAYQRRTGWHERRPPVARTLAAGVPGG